ncbi:hypothetical protein [Rummeliibacillus stabekisii]|uniref:hypothetical protein n=1 Tax=Rummeliibacillus stabekisii TaxID=241244 RepID=UPI00116AC51B|nr:hypothetical protein [Rummeliibacillus stabekisii]MBB5171635.1 hypothetical protein [Rummeliibacillus stabekisii]GEL05482.1 hypothetical protein RST01_21090 [Rummeliibacillus stabekisii]
MIAEFEQDAQQPFLGNFKVDTKEYLDLIIDHIPEIKQNTLHMIFIPFLLLITGYIGSNIESPYITLFFFCLFLIISLLLAFFSLSYMIKDMLQELGVFFVK